MALHPTHAISVCSGYGGIDLGLRLALGGDCEQEISVKEENGTLQRDLIGLAKEYRSLLVCFMDDRSEQAYRKSCVEAIARIDAVLDEVKGGGNG